MASRTNSHTLQVITNIYSLGIFHFSLSCIGEGNGSPLQYSCLENPRDRGAQWAAIYGVAGLDTTEATQQQQQQQHSLGNSQTKEPCASQGTSLDMYYGNSQINRKYKSVLIKDSDEKTGGGGSLKYSVIQLFILKEVNHTTCQSTT